MCGGGPHPRLEKVVNVLAVDVEKLWSSAGSLNEARNSITGLVSIEVGILE